MAENAHDDPHWWAVELWWNAAWLSDVDRVRSGLLALVDAADSNYDLGRIGAGPLENFVSDDEDDLQWLEAQCEHRPKMRVALSEVWCFDFTTADTMTRLDRAAGVPLRHE